jgi:hypothetical protein
MTEFLYNREHKSDQNLRAYPRSSLPRQQRRYNKQGFCHAAAIWHSVILSFSFLPFLFLCLPFWEEERFFCFHNPVFDGYFNFKEPPIPVFYLFLISKIGIKVI